MLRIYEVVLELIRAFRAIIAEIERHDSDLARQLRRALTSVPLNIAEGSRSRGKNRNARYQNAAGSMEESIAAVEAAAALGYLTELPADVVDRSRYVIGVLMKCARTA